MSTSQTLPVAELGRPTDPQQPTSWPGVAAGLVVFIIASAFLLATELPARWGAAAPSGWLTLALWGMLLVPAAGVCAGWMFGFPRWSYPYAGLAALIALYMTNASTPGLEFFGYPVFGREVWGSRALMPLAIACTVALAASRSFQPVGTFFKQMFADRTLAVYLMTAFLPIIVFVAFDEIASPYTLAFYGTVSAILFLLAGIYLRSHTFRRRAFALIAGTLATLSITFVAASLYWYRLDPQNVYLPGMFGWAVCLAGFILCPLIPLGMTRALARLPNKPASQD